tara:strand:- start:231 stop:536 length:306 start_codon:yes stop_codon:yes gene_type:complete
MWNYRIIKDGETYGLYEVFYNDDGEISAHSENPEVVGESVEDIKSSLELMLKDVKKNFSSFFPLVVDEEKILEKDKIEFKDLYDPEEKLESIDIEDLNLDK